MDEGRVAEILRDFVFESNAIENIKDDKKRLEKEIGENKPDGYIGAALYFKRLAMNKKRLLREGDIKKAQGLIVEEQGERGTAWKLKSKWIGEYRDVGVSIAGRECPPPAEAPKLMKNLLARINEWQKIHKTLPEIHNWAALADFHYDFERIHPFIDGNGRTGRLIVLYLAFFMDKEPFIFTNNDKYALYYPCFQTEERIFMRNYFYGKSGNRG